MNDSLRKMNAYRDKYHINYPLIFDEGSRMTRSYGVYGTPTVIILDRRGIVTEEINPVTGAGSVRVDTEMWRATSDSGPIPEQAAVRVVEVRGARLVVEQV